MVASAYYTACERLEASADRQVFAVACLIKYNPRSTDGYAFGYKDMTEHMGPRESDRPAAILDELTMTDNEHASD